MVVLGHIGNNNVLAQTIPSNSNKNTLEQLGDYAREGRKKTKQQVTSVFQLRDVSPRDWAYEALRSLVERYGCIEGYPNRTFRGNRALSRYEFAAGLNACMQQLERLIASSQSVLREDIQRLQRLLREFEAELAALGARVDNLEGRVAFLEDNQFSTTTKLLGEVVFLVSGIANGENNGEDIDQITTFGNRVRFELETSFTGEDLLFTRLSTGNIPDLSEEAGTPQAGFEVAQPDDNDLGLEVLFYEFPVVEDFRVWFLVAGGAADDFTDTFNVLDGDGSSGPVSGFGTRNPIYFPVEDAGIGSQLILGDFEISAGYLAVEAADPTSGSGLFNGPSSAIGQVGYKPTDEFGVAFTYVHTFNQVDTGTGSSLSNFQSFTEELFGEAIPAVSDAYGIEFSWKIADQFIFGGWGAYTIVSTLDSLGGQIEQGSLDIFNWALTFTFPDALKEGNRAAIIFGMPPSVSDSSVNIGGVDVEDEDASFHIEAFYEYGINDNIVLTPGIIVVTSPDFNDSNSTLVIGTIRTTFTF